MSPFLSVPRTKVHPHRFAITVFIVVVALVVSSCLKSCAATDSDSYFLMKLKQSLTNANVLADWNGSVPPCNGNTAMWTGLRCINGSVSVIQLEGLGLAGSIDVDALAGIPMLHAVSFKDNDLSGPMPDFGRLSGLKTIFLSNNRFSGEIPADRFSRIEGLRKVWLSGNSFSGPIPTSLKACTRLRQLRLEYNHFGGKIPDFRQAHLTMFNVSYNELEGKIPANLKKIDPTSFEGNKALCGPPLQTVCPLDPTDNSKKRNIHALMITIFAIIAIMALVAVLCAGIFVFLLRRHKVQSSQVSPYTSKVVEFHEGERRNSIAGKPSYSNAHKKHVREGSDMHGLIFVKDDRKPFDFRDLLRASAEILGSGSFGSSYKAQMLDGYAVVVKKYKEMNSLGKEGFHDHMRTLGRLKHPNILPLVSYYYRREEKLLVYEHVPNGSLVYLLHAKHTSTFRALDWPTRLKIVKGVARGLAYLHTELPNMVLPHGHLKSSNVLIGEGYEPLLTDYALEPVTNKPHATHLLVAYKSPEFASCRHVTNKSDVWSLGVLILEMLTGKIPLVYLRTGAQSADLPDWVRTKLREEWTGEIFDSEMRGIKGGESEVLKLLQIGLACCENDVEKRWGVMDALAKIEEVNEREAGLVDDDDDDDDDDEGEHDNDDDDEGEHDDDDDDDEHEHDDDDDDEHDHDHYDYLYTSYHN